MRQARALHRPAWKKIEELDVSLVLMGKADHRKHAANNDTTNDILRLAHCDVMVMRPGSKDAKEAEHIVVADGWRTACGSCFAISGFGGTTIKTSGHCIKYSKQQSRRRFSSW